MLRSREELCDDLGRDWLIETEIHNGFAQVFITPPGEPRRQLTRRRTIHPRPRRDAEEPLPLEIP